MTAGNKHRLAASHRWRSALILANIAALVWLLSARIFGPSDLWDNTQVKTVAYTTDIIVQGGAHWILPIERGELPATKPPLYNWLAVPGVKWLGFDSEIAHKLPSIAGLLAGWLILVRLGRRLAHENASDESLGWLAGLVFLANPMMFKLGYTARPDMPLTLWLLVAWMSATAAFIKARSGATASDQRESAVQSTASAMSSRPTRWRSLAMAPALVFWLAVTLAAVTKGPAVLVVLLYALLAARIVGGRWSGVRALHPIIGLLICLVICGAWVYGVWRINPGHLRDQLWFNEIYGRISGEGAEGTDHGQRRWLPELPYQSFYFLTRFAPWSIAAVIGGVAVLMRRGKPMTSMSLWMRGAALQTIITIGLYTLSVGQRADYIASAIPPAALLAAWWLLHGQWRIAMRLPWLCPLTAAIVLGLLTWHNQRETAAPQRGFGDAIMRFAHQANAAIAADPAHVVTFAAGQTHLQAMMGIVEPDARRDIARLIDDGRPFWVVAGRTQNPPYEFDRWVAQHRLNAEVKAAAQSEKLPREDGWPEQVTLWRVTPR